MPGFSFSFRRPFIPENINPIFPHYQFHYTISIEQGYIKCLPVLHEQSSQHTPWAAIRMSTAGSQHSGHFSSLINPRAFQVSYLQQGWSYSPSSAYSVTLSKQQRAKNVFILENVRYGKKWHNPFFLNTLYQCFTQLRFHCLQLLYAFNSWSVLNVRYSC